MFNTIYSNMIFFIFIFTYIYIYTYVRLINPRWMYQKDFCIRDKIKSDLFIYFFTTISLIFTIVTVLSMKYCKYIVWHDIGIIHFLRASHISCLRRWYKSDDSLFRLFQRISTIFLYFFCIYFFPFHNYIHSLCLFPYSLLHFIRNIFCFFIIILAQCQNIIIYIRKGIYSIHLRWIERSDDLWEGKFSWYETMKVSDA